MKAFNCNKLFTGKFLYENKEKFVLFGDVDRDSGPYFLPRHIFFLRILSYCFPIPMFIGCLCVIQQKIVMFCEATPCWPTELLFMSLYKKTLDENI